MTNNGAKCSFCHKTKDQSLILISGIDAYICESCVDKAHQIIQEEVIPYHEETNKETQPSVSGDMIVLTPKQIKERLDQYVIGQDDGKKFWRRLQPLQTDSTTCQG